jgi:hypothetical protein
VCIIRTGQCISPEVTVKFCIYNAVDGTDDSMLWNGSAEDGNVRSITKMKALTVKMETVTVNGKGR